MSAAFVACRWRCCLGGAERLTNQSITILSSAGAWGLLETIALSSRRPTGVHPAGLRSLAPDAAALGHRRDTAGRRGRRRALAAACRIPGLPAALSLPRPPAWPQPQRGDRPAADISAIGVRAGLARLARHADQLRDRVVELSGRCAGRAFRC